MDLIREFIAYLVAHRKDVLLFLNKPNPPKSAVFGLTNIGHFFWNDASGLQHMLDSGALRGVERLITVPTQFMDYKKLFPELAFMPHTDVAAPRDVFAAVLRTGTTPIRFTEVAVTKELFERMGRVSKEYAQSLPAGTGSPLLWINLRANNKVWVDQVNGYVNILNEIQSEYGSVSAIMQGMPDCAELFKEIEQRVKPGIKLINGLDLDIFDKFAWAAQVDAYICVAGAGLTFVTWFADVPGVAHSELAHLDHLAWWSDVRPGSMRVLAPQPSEITELGVGAYVNYEVDWRVVLTLLRAALQQKPKMQTQ